MRLRPQSRPERGYGTGGSWGRNTAVLLVTAAKHRAASAETALGESHGHNRPAPFPQWSRTWKRPHRPRTRPHRRRGDADAPRHHDACSRRPDAVCRQHRVHAHLLGPGDAHDPGPRLLLRRHGPRQEHPQHADDELHQPRDRHDPVGALRIQPRLRHRQPARSSDGARTSSASAGSASRNSGTATPSRCTSSPCSS